MQRRLTVIFSADVVGYSRLMERDEAGTLERLKANRKAIFDPCVARHGGRIVKLMGDGALVEFGSVVSAVNCAQEMQRASEAEPYLSEPERIRYRVGINLGEVVVEGDDIYGDGVNVAARLQELADPGGVALSQMVRDQVAGKVAGRLRRSRRAPGQEHRAPFACIRVARGGVQSVGHGAFFTAIAHVGLRAAFRQHERRPRAGVFQRRHYRGHHHRPVQGVRARRRVAEHRVHVQRQTRRDRASRAAAERYACARRQRAQVGQPRADHGTVDRRSVGCASVGRALRPRSQRHFRAAGRNLRGDRQRPETETAAGREKSDRAAFHFQSRGVQALPDGAPVQRDG